MNQERHLCLNEVKLQPGEEWSFRASGWRFLCLKKGLSYFCRNHGAVEMEPGEVFLMVRNTEATCRSSQLDASRIVWFEIDPDLLGGFMTMAECQFFAEQAPRSFGVLRHFEKGHPVAIECISLDPADSSSHPIKIRCKMLMALLSAFDGDIPIFIEGRDASAGVRARFEKVAGNILLRDMVTAPLHQLARECGCSVRHFRRLFRQHYGISLREQQIELRLQKARQLLKETNDKVMDVAYNSGYRHLGLFHQMFKKRYGMTPNEWRRQRINAKIQTGIEKQGDSIESAT